MSRRTESPYASLARPAKRDRIVAAIDADFALHGHPLFGNALLSLLRAAPEAFWAKVGAKVASKKARSSKAPSVAARELVLKVYETRTEGDRLAREYLARTLGQVAA